VALLKDLAERSRRLEINRTEDLKSMQERTVDGFKALCRAGNGRSVDVTKALETLSTGNTRIQATHATIFRESGTDGIFLDLSEQARKAVIYAADKEFIQELSFTEMRYRELKIKPAHYETLEWIFLESELRPSPSHFTKWLKNGDGTFWISGKPGSGKSTLMKYIVESHETERLLSHWSRDATLVSASFYFWSAGTSMQKSIDGLLRSLVCQILRQCPSLIPIAFPEKWQWLMDGKQMQSIEREDIFKAIECFTRIDHHETKFCFFIDGLDEYDGFDRDIAAMIKKLALSPSVKLCLASRPHNVFVNDFGRSAEKMFYVHDFTTWDIRQYIRGVFEGDPTFISRKNQDLKGYQQLAESIQKDANGVFLWVYLVILQLLDGMQNADRMSDLQRRLDKLPKDLRSLFNHMLNSVEEDYHEQQAQMLLVACQAMEPLSLIAFSFLDEEDPDFALNCPVEDLSFEVVENRCEDMRKRLVARCRLLLEVWNTATVEIGTDNVYGGDHVTFLHRTVRDYLRESEAQKLLESRLRTAYDPGKAICNGLLAQLKLLGPDSLGIKEWRYWENNGPAHCLILQFMHQAKAYEDFNGVPLGVQINQIEATVQKRKGNERPFYWWMEPGSRGKASATTPSGGESRGGISAFLKIIIDYELSLYLKWRFDTSTLQEILSPMLITGLLGYCLQPLGPRGTVVDRQRRGLNASITKVFLDHGANPNGPGPKESSPWQDFVEVLGDRPPRYDIKSDQARKSERELFLTLEHLILRGADPFLVYFPLDQTNKKSRDGGVTVERIIENAVTPDNATYLIDLLQQQRKLRKGKIGWYGLLWKGAT
jgi:hypothetical protein